MDSASYRAVSNKGMMDLFHDKCRNNGLKITHQRVSVYEELVKASDHPSADIIHKRLLTKYPNLSLDTVNRTLLTFADIGMAQLVEGYGDPRRYDQNLDNHHHFRCVRCRRIIDFFDRELNNLPIPKRIEDRCLVLKKKVLLEGVCDQCRTG